MLSSARLRSAWSLAAAALVASCAHRAPAPERQLVAIRVLAVNDFHGQLEPGKALDGHPAGSAPVLASWLRAERTGREGRTLLVSAGDLVSASPPASSLAQDEPTIMFVNQLAGERCAPLAPERRADPAALEGDPRCDVVATVGNHEFDRGLAELLRLVRGGDHPRGPFLEAPWRGARYPYVAANVVDVRTGAPVFPPAVIREVGGVRVGVVGAVLREVPQFVNPAGVAGLAFLDPAEAVNRAARALTAQGVRAIVVLIHDGGSQEPYPGPTRAGAPESLAPVAAFVARLDPEVDVVASAHTHSFTNARLPNAAGRPVLVTQAFSAGMAFARIDLDVDPATGDVARSSAEIVPARADAGPGLTPDPAAARLLAAAQEKVGARLRRVVATASRPLARGARSPPAGETGESALGNLVADAYRAALQADVGVVQPGALRADLPAGPVTWGHLQALSPFGGAIVRVTLSGRELKALLEQQWAPPGAPSSRPDPCILHVSGLRFTWDGSRPHGSHVVEISRGGAPLRMDASYSVAAPRYLVDGGDGFTGFAAGRDRVDGPLAIDALERHLAALPQPFTARVEGRVARRASGPAARPTSRLPSRTAPAP